MQSQLEWDEKKFIKFEMKKGRSKMKNTQYSREGFPNKTERWKRGLRILLGGILTI